MAATKVAAKQAYERANLKPRDMDFAEVHDCFTIAELLAIEDLGFFKKGEGGKATEAGKTALNGTIPINTSGGLKGKGHPVGATGVAQAVEAFLQLNNTRHAIIHYRLHISFLLPGRDNPVSHLALVPVYYHNP